MLGTGEGEREKRMRQGPVLCHRWVAIYAERKPMKNNAGIGVLLKSMA